MTILGVLQRLEELYGPQEVTWPTDPYLYLVWLHCGYPASDERCRRGWQALRASVGVEPKRLLAASDEALVSALKPGGMIPEVRAMRLREIAMLVLDECSGDLHAALKGPLLAARKLLKRFPNLADPGADRILLFAGLAPVAAVPSNCPHVIVRIMQGKEGKNYGATYKQAQRFLSESPETLRDRQRAFLLLKRHGQEVCKAARPRCDGCALQSDCAYAAGRSRAAVLV